ncbi:PD-(D/E)XK nuclease family protein [Peptostreptococcus canis]|nr:PD-(D/E)XK nuclease family protein [Peptostreptococcus canis]MBP1997760.1 hypothetical protein [Peptostreptococcus canis]
MNRKILEYRVDNLIFSQNMLNTWKRDKKEFFDKYIMDIFWSDDTDIDMLYDENMLYGREFHTMCQRIFMDIPPYSESNNSDLNLEVKENLKKIENIKNAYIKKYGDDVEFLPECVIELKGRIQSIFDLIVKIYKNGKLYKVDIWDWKTEGKKIEKSIAEKKMQTIVYLYVCKMSIAKDIACDNISMHYYQPAIDNNIRVQYSDEKHKKYEKIILNTIDDIKKSIIDIEIIL